MGYPLLHILEKEKREKRVYLLLELIFIRITCLQNMCYLKINEEARVEFYTRNLNTQHAPYPHKKINPEVKKILAELCSFPLMNVHYQRYRLTSLYPDSDHLI